MRSCCGGGAALVTARLNPCNERSLRNATTTGCHCVFVTRNILSLKAEIDVNYIFLWNNICYPLYLSSQFAVSKGYHFLIARDCRQFC